VSPASVAAMTTPKDNRTDPPSAADERASLEGFLDFHRQTLLWKCAELAPDQLRLRRHGGMR
jgi:hypothetical protein